MTDPAYKIPTDRERPTPGPPAGGRVPEGRWVRGGSEVGENRLRTKTRREGKGPAFLIARIHLFGTSFISPLAEPAEDGAFQESGPDECADGIRADGPSQGRESAPRSSPWIAKISSILVSRKSSRSSGARRQSPNRPPAASTLR